MKVDPSDQTPLDAILKLVAEREYMYETAVQTTVCGKAGSTWQHLLTKLDFVCKNRSLPEPLTYEYPNVVILRRSLSNDEVHALLNGLVSEHSVQTSAKIGSLSLPGRFSMGGNIRRPHSEWSRWPADVFVFEPPSAHNFPGNSALIAIDAPYYPSFEQVLSEFFEIRFQNWTNYFRGQAVIVIPDFRARISNLTIALACLKADMECCFVQPTDLVAKVYAENSVRRLIQKTIRPESTSMQIDMADTPSFACLALMCEQTREVLDERTFRANASWRDPGVFVEEPEDEIEQMLLTGESDTLEFKEKLDKGVRDKLVKTSTAFANTKGGTIVFGVDDDHRAVGCQVEGMSDTITNIIRDNCDPPPEFTIRVVQHEGKNLLLVRIVESSGTVHIAKDRGPYIRANGTTRAPNSYELESLFRRRQSTLPGLHGLR